MRILGFEKTLRSGSGTGHQTSRTYYDYFIDNVSLKVLLETPQLDMMSRLGVWDAPFQLEAILEMQRKKESALTGGRVILYCCPECGDLDCGALSVKIKRANDQIIWSEFGFTNNFETRYDDFAQIQPIHFEKTQYFKALASLRLELNL